MVKDQLTTLERFAISRDPKRMRAKELIKRMVSSKQEICGDRLYGDDKAVICSFSTIGTKKILIIAQDKGFDTQSRIATNFGMMHPEGFRKALRTMKLAEKFGIPVVTIIDTPGAYPGLSAEERGQGFAIARNLLEMSRLKTPILSIILSEGCSGGALGLCVADKVAMLENAYFSVISPEGCASILFKDVSLLNKSVDSLKIQSKDQLLAEVVDDVIPESTQMLHDPMLFADKIKNYILSSLDILSSHSSQKLVLLRMKRYRGMGAFELDSIEASV